MTTRYWLTALLFPVLAASALAQQSTAQQAPSKPPQNQGGAGGEQPHRGPPPEALAACKGKASAASCEFSDREGQKRAGTCFAPADKPLACRPAGGPPKKG